MKLKNLLHLENESMNLADFLNPDTILEKLKYTLIIIGWVWSNMSMA